MKRATLYLFFIIILGLLAFSFYRDFRTKNPDRTIPLSEQERAWTAFENYLTAAKNHDLPAVQKLSQKLSPTCFAALTDETKKVECYSRLDQGYSLASTYTKENFTHILSDSKQVILFSDAQINEDDSKKTSSKTLLYFTKDTEGTIKILGLDPDHRFTVDKKDRTLEQIDLQLNEMTKDTDQDGLEDQLETCAIGSASCAKTDPTKKDSDGDGYWDSIDPLL